LMELFIKYQIPSDLLSYAGRSDDKATKVSTVKAQVKAMQDMINNAKLKQIDDKKQVDAFVNAAPQLSDEEEYADHKIEEDMNDMVESNSMLKYDNSKSVKSKKVLAKPSAQKRSAVRKPMPRSSSLSPSSSSSPTPSSSAQPSAQPSGQPAQKVDLASQQSQQQQSQQQPTVEHPGDDEGVEAEDYTKIPGTLDKKFEELDEDSALRPTIIQIGPTWQRRAQKALLAPPVDQSVMVPQQEQARNQAFDLLDSLSRNGALAIDAADFHVILASTHCFSKNLMNTVIQDNVNPIEKVERSLLIVGTTIQGRSAEELVREDQFERASTYSAKVFEATIEGGDDIKAIEAAQ